MSKSIWFINHYAGTSYYGMEYRHYFWAKELVARGYKVSIIASAYTHLLNKFPKVEKKILYEENARITFLWIKTPKYEGNGIDRIINMLSFTLKVLKNYKKFNLPIPDFVIPSSPHPFVAINGIKIAKHYNAKLFFEIRDIWPLSIIELTNYGKYNPFNILLSIIEKYACKKADALLSPLPNLRAHLENNLHIKNKEIYYIPNGSVVDEFIKTDKNNITYELKKVIRNKFTIGFAGTVGRTNSIDILIKAANETKHSNQIHYVIIGSGPQLKEVKRMAENYKLQNVTFTGKMSRKDVLDALLNFDVLYNGAPKCNLYEYGVSPIKLSEYMMLKKPIINAMQAYNDPVKEAGCGVSVIPENAHSLVKGIDMLKNMSSKERDYLGNKGRSYVENNLTYSILADRLIKVIENF